MMQDGKKSTTEQSDFAWIDTEEDCLSDFCPGGKGRLRTSSY